MKKKHIKVENLFKKIQIVHMETIVPLVVFVQCSM